MNSANENVKFLLADTRNCKSNNLQRFFRSHAGKRMISGLEIIRLHNNNELWFATLGWCVREGVHTGYAGVSVRSAACQGGEATTGYPIRQTGSDYDVVTDWFWDKYKERGVVSIPEIWRIKIPHPLKHAESHTV